VVGQTLKIGGSAAGDKFATAALNVPRSRSRRSRPMLMTLANKPSGWTTDAGTGKTIKVWFGDVIKNGVLTNATRVSGTIEKGFLGQATPTYIVGRGQTVNTGSFSLKHKDKVPRRVQFHGHARARRIDHALDASPDAVTTGSVSCPATSMSAALRGRLAAREPNFCRSLEISINNNLRRSRTSPQAFAAGMNEGECTVEVKFETYYGDATYRTKYLNGTPTSIHTVLEKNSQRMSVFIADPRAAVIADHILLGWEGISILNYDADAARDT
jgi:hypothetical protein